MVQPLHWNRRAGAMGALALALLSYLAGLALYLSAGESLLVRGLWLAGPLLLLASYLPVRPAPDQATDPPADAWWEWALLALITAAAFALRARHLTAIPGNIDGDITVVGREALLLIGQPAWIGVNTYFQFPQFFYMLSALSMRLFGQDLYGLFLGSVLIGVATVPAVFWLGRELADRRVGLLAAALLTISYTHNHLSRIVIPSAAMLIVILFCAALWRGLRTGRGAWFALAGIFFGLSPLVYYSARVTFAILPLIFLWLLIWQRRQITDHWRHWLAFGFGALLAFGPMLGYTVQHFDTVMGRTGVVTLTDPAVYEHLLSKYGVSTFPALLLRQIERTFLTFYRFSDTSPQFAFPGPMLDWLSAALLTLGLGLALVRLREARAFLLLSWFIASLVLGGVLTNDPPNWVHLGVVLPAAVILAGQAGAYLWSLLARPLDRFGRLALTALFIIALTAVGVHNWQTYARWSVTSAQPRTSIARFISRLPGETQVLLVQEPFSWEDSVFQFLNHNVNGRNITFEEIRQGILPPAPVQEDAAPLAFIVPPEQRDLLPALQAAYERDSGALVSTQEISQNNWPLFSALQVTAPGYSATLPPAGLGGDNPWPGLLAIGGLVALFLLLALRAWRRRAPTALPAADVAAAAVPFAMTPVADGAAAPSADAVEPTNAAIAMPADADVPALPPAVLETAPQVSPPAIVADETEAAPAAGATQVAEMTAAAPGAPAAAVELLPAAQTGEAKPPASAVKPLLRLALGRFELSLTRRELALAQADQAAAPTVDEEPEAAPPLLHITWRRLVGILLALALAYLAQAFFDGDGLRKLLANTLGNAMPLGWFEPNRMRIGAALYLLAMGLFAWLAPPARTRRDPRPVRGRQSHSRVALFVRDLLLFLALGSAGFNLQRFAQQGEDGSVQAIWLLSILLFLASQAPWPAWRPGSIRRLFRPAAAAWLNLLILTVILAAAFWLRVNRLETIPYDFHGDMASYGIQGREIILGNQWRLFQEGWANIPMIGYLPTAAAMALFGNNLFGLNMSAVIAGLLTLLAFYLLLWRLSNSHRLALLGVAVTAVNVPHIHFSRLAAYMDPWPFNLFALFLLVDGLRARRRFSLALAGVLLGFGLQMYYSGRVIFFIIAGFLLFALLFRRDWLKGNWGGLILMALGVLVSLGPSLVYFARNQDALVERSRAVFLFYPAVMNHLMNKYGVTTVWEVVLEQTRLSLLMFHVSADSSTQFGYRHPMFSSAISPLIALGFAYALRRWRTPGAALALIFWLLNLVIGSILTGDAPFWPRLVGMTFSGAWFAALALDRLLGHEGVALVPQRWRRPLLGHEGAALVPLLMVLAVVGWQDWNLYRETVKIAARPQTVIGRYLRDLSTDIAACDFADEYALQVRETAFLAWPRQLVDLPTEAPIGLIENCPGPPFVWIVYPHQPTRLSAITSRWPNGVLEEHRTHTGQVLFSSYLVMGGEPTRGLPSPPVITPEIGAPPAVAGYHAFYPDGSPFAPEKTFLGDETGSVWQINAGRVTVTGGQLTLHTGPLPGHDAVFDYVRLLNDEGQEIRIEAEDLTFTTGDSYADKEGNDGHWWRQAFKPFSGGFGLVAQKGEMAPVLTVAIPAADGEYTLLIGSFKGDYDNGVFGLGLTVVEP